MEVGRAIMIIIDYNWKCHSDQTMMTSGDDSEPVSRILYLGVLVLLVNYMLDRLRVKGRRCIQTYVDQWIGNVHTNTQKIYATSLNEAKVKEIINPEHVQEINRRILLRLVRGFFTVQVELYKLYYHG